MSEAKIEVKLGTGIVEVLFLDSRDICEEYEIAWRDAGRRHIVVTGTVPALERLARICDDHDGPGWDQPAWYVHTARAAAKRIRAVLEQQPPPDPYGDEARSAGPR